jgi:mono/diheme cytochrome c family protein
MRSLLAVLLASPCALAQEQAPTFTEDIAPLVFAHCTRCHRPNEAGPFPLQTYRDVQKRAANLLAVMEDRLMPPWHPKAGYGRFRNEQRLSDQQIATFRAWVEAGRPEGPAAKLPPLPDFPAGWQLGEPDLVVKTSAPFPVPAGGRDIYRNFSLQLDLPEDKWLTAIEVRPGDREVLHHVLLFVDQDRAGRRAEGRDGKPGYRGRRNRRAPMVAGWAVGGQPEHLPQGLAIRIPKGSDLTLQSHLHPSGKATEEQTTIGLYFAEEPPERSLVSVQLPAFFGFLAGIDIPANDADWVLKDRFELPCDVDAVTVGGHAHMLCSSMKMHAVLPDGREVPLLHIEDWDFDWQSRYTFAEQVRLPKGAVVHSELHYDNSAQNPDNPNLPPKRVRWGRETTDEMGSITLLVTPADEADLATLQRAVREQPRQGAQSRVAQKVESRFDALDRDGNGTLSKQEVPRTLRRFFARLDRDGDGQLTLDEARALAGLRR